MLAFYWIFIFSHTSCKIKLPREGKFKIMSYILSFYRGYVEQDGLNDEEKVQLSEFLNIFQKTFWDDNKFLCNHEITKYIHIINWKLFSIENIDDLGYFFLIHILGVLTDFDNYIEDFHGESEILRKTASLENYTPNEKVFIRNIERRLIIIKNDFIEWKNRYEKAGLWNKHDVFDLFIKNYQKILAKKNSKCFSSTLKIFQNIKDTLVSTENELVLFCPYKTLDSLLVKKNDKIKWISCPNIVKKHFIGDFINLKERNFVSKTNGNQFLIYTYFYIAKIISELSSLWCKVRIVDNRKILFAFTKSTKYSLSDEEKNVIRIEQQKTYLKSYFYYSYKLIKMKFLLKRERLKIFRSYDNNCLDHCRSFARDFYEENPDILFKLLFFEENDLNNFNLRRTDFSNANNIKLCSSLNIVGLNEALLFLQDLSTDDLQHDQSPEDSIDLRNKRSSDDLQFMRPSNDTQSTIFFDDLQFIRLFDDTQSTRFFDDTQSTRFSDDLQFIRLFDDLQFIGLFDDLQNTRISGDLQNTENSTNEHNTRISGDLQTSENSINLQNTRISDDLQTSENSTNEKSKKTKTSYSSLALEKFYSDRINIKCKNIEYIIFGKDYSANLCKKLQKKINILQLAIESLQRKVENLPEIAFQSSCNAENESEGLIKKLEKTFKEICAFNLDKGKKVSDIYKKFNIKTIQENNNISDKEIILSYIKKSINILFLTSNISIYDDLFISATSQKFYHEDDELANNFLLELRSLTKNELLSNYYLILNNLVYFYKVKMDETN